MTAPSRVAIAEAVRMSGRDEVWKAVCDSPRQPTAFVRFAEGNLWRPDWRCVKIVQGSRKLRSSEAKRIPNRDARCSTDLQLV